MTNSFKLLIFYLTSFQQLYYQESKFNVTCRKSSFFHQKYINKIIGVRVYPVDNRVMSRQLSFSFFFFGGAFDKCRSALLNKCTNTNYDHLRLKVTTSLNIQLKSIDG